MTLERICGLQIRDITLASFPHHLFMRRAPNSFHASSPELNLACELHLSSDQFEHWHHRLRVSELIQISWLESSHCRMELQQRSTQTDLEAKCEKEIFLRSKIKMWLIFLRHVSTQGAFLPSLQLTAGTSVPPSPPPGRHGDVCWFPLEGVSARWLNQAAPQGDAGCLL